MTESPRSAPRVRWRWPAASGALVLVALFWGLFVVPADRYQGDAQRLLYVHVGTVWAAYLCFALVAAGSIGYLIRRRQAFDRWAGAAAEVGVGLTGLTLVLGSLWARPTWGTFWTWDPRLVSTVILLLVYVGYLGVRDLGGDPALTARRSAVLGILAFVMIPIVHFSTVWWRTLHQPPGVLRPGGPQGTMPEPMLWTLAFATAAISLYALALIHARTVQLAARAEVASPATATGAATSVVVRSRTGDHP